MKIVIAMHHFPPRYTGGAELRAYRTAAWLRDHGHDVYVVQDYKEEIDFGNVDWELIDQETSLYKLNKKGKPHSRLE